MEAEKKGNGNGVSPTLEVVKAGGSDLLPVGEVGMIPAAGLQKTQTRYMTAMKVQEPRNLDRIVQAVKREAQYAAESFFYSWGSGKNHVEGPSVVCCRAIAREWGNCAVETDVQETPSAYLFTAHFVDLERGFTASRAFRQSKTWIVYGNMDEARKEDVRFQIGQSKGMRNVIREGVPGWLIDIAVEEAKRAVLEGINAQGIAASVEKAFTALGSHGISEERILAKLGRAGRTDITSADIVDLRTAYAAIAQGEAFADKLFPAAGDGKTEVPKVEAGKPEPKNGTKPQTKEEEKPEVTK